MNWLRKLLWTMRHEWRLHILIPVLGIPVILLSFAWQDPLRLEKEHGEPVIAHIKSMNSLSGSRYQGAYPGFRVSAKTENGIRGYTTVIPTDIEGCKIGDQIEAEQVGMVIYLYPKPCE